MQRPQDAASEPKVPLRTAGWAALVAWALFDWAGSPFTTLILTFVMPVYFARAVVGDVVRGQSLWGYALAVSGLVIATTSPLLGAIADAGGRNKLWLLASSMICISASFLFWFVRPAPAFLSLSLILIVVANASYATSVVFNNALLPDLAPKDQTGRWSGWAWALGYAGGLTALVLAFEFFIGDRPIRLPLDPTRGEHIRILGPLVALWFVVFGWPRFVWTPDRPATGLRSLEAMKRGLTTLKASLAQLLAKPNIFWFLVANMLYADALAAIFAVGGIYAAGAFKMTLAQVTIFGIMLNVAAGLGAFGFAWVDDWIGSRKTILLALIGLIASAAMAVWVKDRTWFCVAGAGLGIFVGPAQSASRTLMARLAPEGQEHEFFGLFALSGKATAFLGPALVAVTTSLSGSQRVGLACLLILFAAGAACLLRVSEPEIPDDGALFAGSHRRAQNPG